MREIIRDWILGHLEQHHLEPQQSVPQEGVVQPPGDVPGAGETSETQPAQQQEGEEQKE